MHPRNRTNHNHSRSQTQRGGRNLWQTLARLPQWARDLYQSWEEIGNGRQLRLIRNALEELLRLLNNLIIQVAAEEDRVHRLRPRVLLLLPEQQEQAQQD